MRTVNIEEQNSTAHRRSFKYQHMSYCLASWGGGISVSSIVNSARGMCASLPSAMGAVTAA